jgi:hypothetical protein
MTNQVFVTPENLREAIEAIFAKLRREVAGLRASLDDRADKFGRVEQVLAEATGRLAKLECQSAIPASLALKIQS